VRELLINYREAEDLINVGAYQEGNNPQIDEAIRNVDQINTFLRQDIDEHIDFQGTEQQLMSLLGT
jgi:flagellum-specific ATP synthase